MKNKKLVATCFAIVLMTVNFVNAQKTVNKIVLFEVDKYDIEPQYFSALDSLCEMISGTEYQLNLYGRADSTGFVEDNMILSKNRVEVVTSYLIENGIDQNKIKSYYYGENKPLFSNDTYIILSANRSVLISMLIVEEEKKTSKEIWKDFESELVIETDAGTIIEIEAGAFFPHKLEDVEFDINEVYSICDIVNNGSSLQTENGNCLSSAGMLYVTPTVEGDTVQPKGEGQVVIKIPLLDGQQFDPDMKLYYEDWDEENNSVWKEYDAELSFEEDQQSYYVFELDEFRGMNIDKTFGLICEKSGPKVKVRKYKSADVCQTYPGEMYLSRGEYVRKRTFRLDEVDTDKDPDIVVLAYDKHGLPYISDQKVVEIKYRKRDNTYIIKRKSFKRLTNEDSRPEESLCNAIND